MSVADRDATNGAGLLSDATIAALQLRQQPFTELAADGDHFADDTTAEQLADIKQALITGDDLLLILGERGAGKSTLLAQLGANSGLRIQCFSVRGSERFSTHNLFAGMLEAFKASPSDDLKQMLDTLVPHLQRMVGNNILSAIVLDNADHVTDGELTRLLSSMLYLNSQDETLMRVALAADEPFESRIPELLPEGADLPYSSLVIEPLTDERASNYLEFRLNQAGHFDAFPFSDRDIETMNERAGGRPATLHQLAAEQLNERHGALPLEVPSELLSGSAGRGGMLAGRGGKMALGALALALILGGLLLSRPRSTVDDAPRYTVVEQRPLGTSIASDDTRISLVDEGPAAAGPETDATSSESSSSTSGTTPIDDTTNGTANVTDSTAGNTATGTPVTATAPTTPDQEPARSAAAVSAAAQARNTAATVAASTNADASGDADGGDSTATNETPSETRASTAPAPVAVTPPAPADGAPASATAVNESTVVPDAASTAAPTTSEPATSEPVALAEPTAEPASQPAAEPAGALGRLESPNWILVQDGQQFTVQMSASTDRGSVENFLQRTDLEGPNSIFAFDRDGTTWYALVHGLFPSIEAARTAVERMPSSAQTNQPWIRAVGRIQAALKEQN